MFSFSDKFSHFRLKYNKDCINEFVYFRKWLKKFYSSKIKTVKEQESNPDHALPIELNLDNSQDNLLALK